MASLPSHLSTTPMAAPVVALALGIALGRVGEVYAPMLVAAGMVSALVAAVAVYGRRFMLHGARRMMHAYAHRNSVWLMVLPLFFALGAALIYSRGLPADDVLRSRYMRGTVLEKVSKTGSDRLVVSVDACGDADASLRAVPPFKARIYVREAEVHAGDVIVFSPELEAVRDDEEHRLRGDAGYLYSCGIDAEGRVEPSRLSVTGRSDALRFKALELRDGLVARIETSRLQRGTIDFLNAILLGDTEGLAPALRGEFASAGIAHVLALSGLHAGIVLLLLGALLLPLDMAGCRTLRYLLMAAGILGFAWLTGMGASITRAAVMGAVLMGSRMLQRPHATVNSLCVAAFLILFFDPRALFHCGFQLSFLCTLAILVCVGPSDARGIPVRLLKTVETSLVVFLASWPLMAWHFHSLSLIFLPLNLLALPLLPPFVGLAVIYLLLHGIGVEAGVIAWGIDSLYGLLESCARMVASWPAARIALYPHPLVPLLGLFSAFGIFYLVRTRSRAAWACAAMGSGAMLLAMFILPPRAPLQALCVSKNVCAGGVSCYREGETNTLVPQDFKITHMSWDGASVLYMDAMPDPGHPLPEADLLIVGPHCRLEPEAVYAYAGRAKVVLSAMMRKKRAAGYLHYASVHSLPIHDLHSSKYIHPL